MAEAVSNVAQQTSTSTRSLEALRPVLDELRAGLEALSLDVHREPELAWSEHAPVRKLVGYLEEHGIAIELPYCDLDTAFGARVELPGDGPTVSFMAENDALPELGHACGHNLICAASVGAAVALARTVQREGLGGTIQMIGTPAEEGGGGQVVLLERYGFNGTDVAMMFHPGARTMTIRGALAASRVTVRFHGKSAHASSNPHLGINALDACLLTFNAIDAMRQHLRDETRIHGIITKGGSAPNVVPDFAEAMFIVRHRSSDYMHEVRDILYRCARGSTESVGATVEFDEGFSYDESRNNHMLAYRFGGYLQALGEPVLDAPCVGGVGSSDFGNVSKGDPAIHPYVSIVDEGTSNHTREFTVAAGSERGMRGMRVATSALAMTGMDVLSDSNFLDRVRAEFAGRV